MNKLLLEIEGKKYPLLSSTFNSYNRGTGMETYPTDNTFTLQIKLVRVDKNLNDWFYNVQGQTKSGKITLFNEDEVAVYEVCFLDAQTSSINGNLNSSQGEYGNDLMITLTAETIFTNVL